MQAGAHAAANNRPAAVLLACMHTTGRAIHHRCRALPAAAAGARYKDPAGGVLPADMAKFLDTWKRPEELVQTSPIIPLVLLKGAPGAEAAAAPAGKAPAGERVPGKAAACWRR